MIKLNARAQHVFLYGLGIMSTKIISFIMLPIVTRILNPEEYGTLEVILTFLNLLGIGVCFGLSNAIFRFGGTANSMEEKEIIYTNAIFQSFMVGLVFCIPTLLLSAKIATILPGKVTQLQIIYLALSLLVSNAWIVHLDWLRLKDDVTRFVLASIICSLFQAIMIFVTLKAGYGVTGMVFSMFITGFITSAYFIIIELKKKIHIDFVWQKKLFWFGFPLVFGGFAEFVMQSVNWWIAHLDGTAELALFAIAMKFSMISTILIQPINMWWFPNRFKNLDTLSGRVQTGKIGEISTVLGFLLCFSVAIFSVILIFFLTPEQYHKSIIYLPWLCFMIGVKNAGDNMNLGLYLNSTTNPMMINIILAIIAILGFYFYIPLWHTWGAIFVLNVVYLIRWFLYAYLSQQKIHIPYRYSKLTIFTMGLVICLVIMQSIGITNIVDYIIKGSLLFALLIFLTYSLNYFPEVFTKESRKL